MKKMIIIEDNTRRQKDFYLGKTKLSDINILHNAIGNKYDNIYEELKLKKFKFNFNFIAVHESAFGKDKIEIIEYLKDTCKELNKILIFFSGGISATNYKLNPTVLYLNEKIFYKNLELFLESVNQNNMNIQILGYGQNWETNVLNSVYKNIVKVLQNINEDSIRFRKFKKETQIELINHLINQPKLSDGFIGKSDIEYLKLDIKKLLDKKMGL